MLKYFSRDLMCWYVKNKRDLPWRHTKDPYKIWISEVMLQQTTINAVIPYYKKWIKTFPTVHDLAQAPLQRVLKLWEGLGYYNRAKNLHKAALLIIKNYNGQIPKNPINVRSLPGFGPYTTGSVLSIAYNMPLTIIDANVRRLVMRLLALPGQADTKQDPIINQFLLKVLPPKGAGDFNQALMELGALVCRVKDPDCKSCPQDKYCHSHKENKQHTIPQRKSKIIKDVHAVIAIIKNNDFYYIQKRPSSGLLADLWEFPGGKIRAGESKKQALIREIKEELGIKLISARHLFDVNHFYTQFKAHLSVFDCKTGSPPKTDSTHRWVKPINFIKYPMPSGTTRIISKLIK
ncbi:MAG: A/G-specific adenine glycosylase [Candidatus Omnitrophica bacterium]|nr:A/G-specific adenine glycosylase [Candidatus Omnitrophota bacterium]